MTAIFFIKGKLFAQQSVIQSVTESLEDPQGINPDVASDSGNNNDKETERDIYYDDAEIDKITLSLLLQRKQKMDQQEQTGNTSNSSSDLETIQKIKAEIQGQIQNLRQELHFILEELQKQPQNKMAS
jgi:hypothetical protein